ncbi:hypothetical protein SAMN05878276_2153 [Aquipseudomonas alcaligenes]|uniref:YHS domain-containing (seleno)protein n=1 Tax=Aquipseudomonas alcaligenes TaxID=43263 RepID=UPI0009563B7D|nr:YHS domain-containing (seleno)protein [Pseudomonas alcaligenes]SIS08915.1 hypothetical protein SAMN05878276_2153 [Pseudomonas alcaligenes]
MNLKNSFIATSLAVALATGGAALLTATSSFAYDEASTASINVDAGQVILKGYDTVSYFQGKPAMGDQRFAVKHDGATYYFASAENMKTFQSDAAHYVPQFGGFCAMGAALGKKLDVDPSQYKVVDGKLYLNVNADVFKKWSEDVPGNIAKANANWPSIKDKAPSSL